MRRSLDKLMAALAADVKDMQTAVDEIVSELARTAA
jgi:hypothetical protein